MQINITKCDSTTKTSYQHLSSIMHELVNTLHDQVEHTVVVRTTVIVSHFIDLLSMHTL